jgi:hypothetical protein
MFYLLPLKIHAPFALNSAARRVAASEARASRRAWALHLGQKQKFLV